MASQDRSTASNSPKRKPSSVPFRGMPSMTDRELSAYLMARETLRRFAAAKRLAKTDDAHDGSRCGSSASRPTATSSRQSVTFSN